MMATIVKKGHQRISTQGREYGIDFIQLSPREIEGIDNGNIQVFVSARAQTNGNGPFMGGPLYCPFWRPHPGGIQLIVYDIMANPFNVIVEVDYALIGP
jgi:hypothetical protein